MELFVRAIAGGGIAVVAGLWILALMGTGSSPRVLGAVLVVVGGAGLAYGIASEIDAAPP